MNYLRLHLNIGSLLRLLHADDLQIYIQVPLDQIHHGIRHLSEASCRVAECANSNHLKLNAGKSKAIVFGTYNAIRRFKELQTTSIVINSNGDRAQCVEKVISPRVVLDSFLSWGPLINHITEKVNRAFFGLRFIRPRTTLTLPKRLVESVIMPHLGYCTIVYLDEA